MLKELYMYIGKDEGLPSDHRLDITDKVISIAKTGESFVIKGSRGMGKSKYLRHIANSEAFNSKYAAPYKINFNYLNLNTVYSRDVKQFLYVLCSIFELEDCSLETIEKGIEKSPNIEYLILDQAELLEDVDKEIHKVICSLMSSNKRKFSVIIACNSSKFLLEQKSLEYVMENTSIQIEFTPQNKEQITRTIDQFSKMYETEISKEQKLALAQKSQGSPLFVKQVMASVRAGENFEEALIKFLDPKTPFSDKQDEEESKNCLDLSKYRKYFTRNQYLFFKKLYENKGEVVTREDFANLLSPQSKGVGVSNNSIDQNITRVRKVISETRLPFIVRSKRGVGYILE